MSHSWSYIVSGIIFSLIGVYLFQRNIFETNRKVLLPMLVIIAGIVLLSMGFAMHLDLIK